MGKIKCLTSSEAKDQSRHCQCGEQSLNATFQRVALCFTPGIEESSHFGTVHVRSTFPYVQLCREGGSDSPFS